MRAWIAWGRRALVVVAGLAAATSIAAQTLIEPGGGWRQSAVAPAVANRFIVQTPHATATVATPPPIVGRASGGAIPPAAVPTAIRATAPPVQVLPAASTAVAAPRTVAAPPHPPGTTAVPIPGSGQAVARVQKASLAPMRSATDRRRRVVPFSTSFPEGSIVVVNRERALYHVGADGRAMRYPVAIGSFTEEWTGREIVSDKKVNPSWYPVQEPGASPREPVMGGDPANPLGVRALYLGRTLWRIHGTPAADSIGQAVSGGCIRMLNEHVIELYDNVMLGTEVYVVDRLDDPVPLRRGRKTLE